jgi:Methyltransferase domain
MNTLSCKICGGKTDQAFRARVLGKYDVAYARCGCCDFLQAEDPSWLREAYTEPINKEDTGYVLRNIILARKTFLFLMVFFAKKDRFLDYAGGYGMFVRLMRDMGLDFYWEDKYTKNLFARGFEYDHQKISAITCFECFEHFSDPVQEMDKMLTISKNIFFSTSLYDFNNNGNLPDASWPYYGFSHGQHVSFYSLKTLRYLADARGLHLYSNGKDLHFFSERKISGWKFRVALRLGILPWDMLARLMLKSKTSEDSLSVSVDRHRNV